MNIYLSPLAKQDLAETHAYIAARHPSAAKKVLAAIKTQIQMLQQFPQAGRIGTIPHTRELVMTGLPFIIAYRLKHEDIEIIRIYHTARPALS